MRALLTSTIRFLVSLGLLYLALRGVDFSAIQARVHNVNLWWLGAGGLLSVFQVLLGALRWSVISIACDAPLTNPQAFRYNMIGAFFNQTLPSSIGGDAVRLWLIRRSGAGWHSATYSILTDRAVGLIALALVIVASLPWSYRLIGDATGRFALMFVDLAALGGGVSFLLLAHVPWPRLKGWWLTKHIYACSTIANKVTFAGRSGPKIIVLSVVIHVMTVLIVWCAVRSIAAPADLEQLFLLTPPVMLITSLPISISGWGVREATMMVAFGYMGLAQMDGVAVSILFGAIGLGVGALGGLVWIFGVEKTAKLTDMAKSSE